MMQNLRIIYTGGTIGGKYSPKGDIEDDLKRKKFMEILYEKYPSLENDLKKKNAILSFDTPVREFSENMIPNDWAKIAKSVDKAIKEGVDYIVIAHGTDTMCYTSAALSFMLRGINIPIILTGSNIPLESDGTDAVTNMHDAIRVALDGRFKGIFLVFSGIDERPSNIHLGCRVRKEKFYNNCFKSANVEMIGTFKESYISTNSKIKIVNQQLLDKITEINKNTEYKFNNELNKNISFFKVYPGFDPKFIDYSIEKKTKGIILELYNSGTGCIKNEYSLLTSLKKSKDIPVFVTSQHEGSVLMDLYKSSLELKEAGAVPLKDMITEAAIPKLMWILKQTSMKKEIIELMLTDFCGEINT